MTAKRFLDPNVLLYSISDDPRDATKRNIAIGLVEQPDNALSVQVLQEFYVQATRASRANPLPHETAAAIVRTWIERFSVQDLTVSILDSALEIKAATRLSYWDAAIVAAARALGCTELLSEDMQHGRQIGGVKIVNPFRYVGKQKGPPLRATLMFRLVRDDDRLRPIVTPPQATRPVRRPLSPPAPCRAPP